MPTYPIVPPADGEPLDPQWGIDMTEAVNDHQEELIAIRPLFALKTTNESVTSSTTLQNDDDLVLSLPSSTSWSIDGVLFVDGSTGGDLKIAWTFPTGATVSIGAIGPHINWNATAAAVEVEFAALQNVTSSPTSTMRFGVTNVVPFTILIKGVIALGSTAGSLQMQFAQDASNATATRVMAGSHLTAQQVA